MVPLICFLTFFTLKNFRCQYVDHHIEPGINVLRGVVGICWDLIGVHEYPPKEEGPVTWCTGRHVFTDRKFDVVMTLLRENFPITSPPTYFRCYHAIENYRRMFLHVPDITSWKNKFYFGVTTIFWTAIVVLIYFFKKSEKRKVD